MDLERMMPDLKKIIENVLNVAPDVYLGDFVGDMGESYSGSVRRQAG